ncbi:MAG: hypothetical protein GXO26_00120 [Crenarchaeota archaeon]|nr:hypothetical protein [Thermoproteota archaeon]
MQVKSILALSSNSEKVGGYLCLLIYSLDFFLVRKITRILINKISFLLDREFKHRLGIRLTDLEYVKYFKGAYCPKLMESLEELTSYAYLSKGVHEWEYTILDRGRLKTRAEELLKELKNRVKMLNLDWKPVRHIFVSTIRRGALLYKTGRLISYTSSLPEVEKTVLGNIIVI